MNETENRFPEEDEVSFRFLVIQAVITVVVVLALLLGLRLGGILAVEDAPMEAVEARAEIEA